MMMMSLNDNTKKMEMKTMPIQLTLTSNSGRKLFFIITNL